MIFLKQNQSKLNNRLTQQAAQNDSDCFTYTKTKNKEIVDFQSQVGTNVMLEKREKNAPKMLS